MPRFIRLFSGIALAAGALAWAALTPPDEGVVIEKVRRGSAGDVADLRPGDVLLGWQRASLPPANPRPAEGRLRSPFDLTGVLIEQLPRGGLTLTGRRGWRAHTWFLPGGSAASLWDEIEARPTLPPKALSLYREGKKAWDLGEAETGDAHWHAAATRAKPVVAIWLLARRAEAWSTTEKWKKADDLYSQILASLETRNDPAAAQLLRRWGMTFMYRQYWEQAADCFERALKIDRHLVPHSLAEAWSLTGLGNTASLSGGSRNPEDFLRGALSLREQLAPGSSEVAASWYYLGADAETSGDYALARQHYRRALALQEILTPEGSFVTELLTALGLVRVQSDFLAAEKLFQRALALAQSQRLEGVEVLVTRQRLGRLAERRGDLPAAEEHLDRALALAQKIQPGSWRVAGVLQDLGRVERRAGRLQQSARHLCGALEMVEQRRNLNRTDEERLRWGRQFVDQYRGCTEALFQLGRWDEAFQTLEKGRARAFLALLAERPLRSADLPPGLAQERERLAAEYDRVHAALERLDAGPEPEEAWLLRGKLREIRRRQEAVLAEIRRLSPRFAALHAPEPTDLAGARRALDPGMVLLSYSVGEDRTLLFVIEPAAAGGSGLKVFSLPIGSQALQQKVQSFLALLQDKDSDTRQLAQQARSLYELLLKPAEPWLAKSERVLLCPDSSLHALPFAALMRDGRYLIQWRPLHVILSATAYAEIKGRARPPAGEIRFAAFGAPLRERAAGKTEASLPASRREVEEIAALFPQAQVFLGAEATEERIKQIAASVDILHLAVHGTLDERQPLSSGLVLSQSPSPGSGRDNGLLQAWEILDILRLRADLVTLSACDTARGQPTDGEGLVGLSRAFQIAGARSVLATLWAVSDASTAYFMPSFYGALRRGESRERALQKAQARLIDTREYSHPFHWAAFQLYGI